MLRLDSRGFQSLSVVVRGVYITEPPRRFISRPQERVAVVFGTGFCSTRKIDPCRYTDSSKKWRQPRALRLHRWAANHEVDCIQILKTNSHSR